MLVDNLEILQMKKDNPAMWQGVVEQSIECAEHNYNIFQDNCAFILENIRKGTSDWLKVYSDFTKIF